MRMGGIEYDTPYSMGDSYYDCLLHPVTCLTFLGIDILDTDFFLWLLGFWENGHGHRVVASGKCPNMVTWGNGPSDTGMAYGGLDVENLSS